MGRTKTSITEANLALREEVERFGLVINAVKTQFMMTNKPNKQSVPFTRPSSDLSSRIGVNRGP